MIDMLELVQFENNMWGIRNKITGFILAKGADDHDYEFATPEEAAKYANEITDKLNKTIKEIHDRNSEKTEAAE